ncbi:MAG: hypothetical protein GYB68_14855 [Chloroflexi bacterium]|nr:hypothetical protein [Chloroflexota bacterium]
MRTTISEQEFEELNAYLDGTLSRAEVDIIERRLAQDPLLQEELESLEKTISLLRMSERVAVPRNFTLDPEKYRQSAGNSLFDFLGRSWYAGMATAGAFVVAAVFAVALFQAAGLPDQSLVSESVEVAPFAAEAEEEAQSDEVAAAPTTATSQRGPDEEAGGDVADFADDAAEEAPADGAGPELSEPAAQPEGEAVNSTQTVGERATTPAAPWSSLLIAAGVAGGLVMLIGVAGLVFGAKQSA